MKKFQIQPLVLEKIVESKTEGWKQPLTRKYDHVYFEWRTSVHRSFYSKNQLERLHQHLIHSSAQKLYELLRKADVNNPPSDTLNTLKEISKNCKTCNVFLARSTTFQIRYMDKIKFNHRILLDIMYLQEKKGNSRPVLYIIDAGTKFSVASILNKIDTT